MPAKRRHIAAVFDLKWPYRRHYGLFSGLQDYAREHANWTFDISSYPELELARGHTFDGIIGRITEASATAARKAKIPILNLWIDSPVSGTVPEVHPDFYSAGRMAAEHLTLRGFSRLAYFGFACNAFDLQFRGIQEFAQKEEIPAIQRRFNTDWDECPEAWQDFEATVLEALSHWDGNIGVVCLTDELARAVATICQINDRPIPEEIAIVGTSNDELICNAVDPNLSSIAMGLKRCGYEAGLRLDRMMQGAKLDPEIKLSPPRELVLRRSSDAYSVGDPKVQGALEYMAKHRHEPLTVDKIAQAAGVGRKTLERRFRKQIRRSVNEELTRMRISKFKRLLVDNPNNIADLSETCGFGSLVSMHSQFKRATGMTPRQYREKHGLLSID